MQTPWMLTAAASLAAACATGACSQPTLGGTVVMEQQQPPPLPPGEIYDTLDEVQVVIRNDHGVSIAAADVGLDGGPFSFPVDPGPYFIDLHAIHGQLCDGDLRFTEDLGAATAGPFDVGDSIDVGPIVLPWVTEP